MQAQMQAQNEAQNQAQESMLPTHSWSSNQISKDDPDEPKAPVPVTPLINESFLQSPQSFHVDKETGRPQICELCEEEKEVVITNPIDQFLWRIMTPELAGVAKFFIGFGLCFLLVQGGKWIYKLVKAGKNLNPLSEIAETITNGPA